MHTESSEIPPRIAELLAGDWVGELSEAERAELEAWTAVSPDRRAEVDRLATIWDAHSPPMVTVSAERAADVVLRVVKPTVAISSVSPSITRRHLSPRRGARWTVAGLGLAAVIGIGLWGVRTTVPVSVSDTQHSAHTTGRGQRSTISLPDGSSMVLAPGSRAEVRFAGGERRVELEGRAYFTVAQVANAPFVVATADRDVRVLGTRFVVRRYSEDVSTNVAVLAGRVGVGSAVLGEGDIAQADDSAMTVTRDGDTSAYVSWTNGRLSFQNEPFRDVLTELGRWYDLDFVLDDPEKGSLQVTTTVSDPTLTDASIRSLALLIGTRAARDGRTVTFTAE